MSHPDGARPAHPARLVLDGLDRRLLDEHQRDFPIRETPFAEIAHRLDCDEDEVLHRLAVLTQRGVVSRVGPVFAPGRIGASTLAAMAVPPQRLESVAKCVNRYPAVNHNYEREHELNLWFVLTAGSETELGEIIADIRRRVGLAVLDLRLERAYHIDLGFPLWRRPAGRGSDAPDAPSPAAKASLDAADRHSMGTVRDGLSLAADACATGAERPALSSPAARVPLDAADRRLVGAVQDGLPLTARPYAAVAERIGLTEAQAMQRLGRLLREGVIKRMGVVVRHHELGYRANAMVVFDVPPDRVDVAGDRLARVASVTLCYRRTRRPPVWPYNLYCMLHGRDRSEVMGWVETLLPDAVGDLHREVLFSRRRFRQRGARYAPDPAPAESETPAHG